ncbi:MAG: hypothetical protein AB1921_16105 [Thermodesulfobacteriota bacterium]
MTEKKRAFYYALILWGVLLFHGPQLYLMVFLQFTKAGPGDFADGLWNLGLFLGWAGIHSFLARGFARRAVARLVGADFSKLFYVTVAGLTQTAMIHFWRPLPGVLWETGGLAYAALTALFLASSAFIFTSCLLLDYMEVLGVRAVIRRMRGEPRPEPAFVVRGPYAYCRHPVYLGTLLFLWAGPVMTTTRLMFAVLGTAYLFLGTLLEERTAAAELGEKWRRYCENVPMWLPRLRPWKP